MLHSIAFLLLCSNSKLCDMVCLVIYYNTKEKDIYKYISKKKSNKPTKTTKQDERICV